MPYLERHDASLQDIVQRGLVLDVERGTLKAWIFMKEHGVSDIVMLRVLTRPDQRRLSDTSALRNARSDGLPLPYREG